MATEFDIYSPEFAWIVTQIKLETNPRGSFRPDGERLRWLERRLKDRYGSYMDARGEARKIRP